MYAAAQYWNTDIVRILLEHEADVNTKDNNGLLHNIITLYLNIVSLPYSIYLPFCIYITRI